MKVVLFCGGMGTRMREYSDTIPKPLVPVGGRTMLDRSLDLAEQAGIALDNGIATDAQGYITRVNAAAARLTGWPENEARGQPLAAVLAMPVLLFGLFPLSRTTV